MWRWHAHPVLTNFPPTHGTTWVAFGDSLTAGYGAQEGADYPTVLGKKLGVKIINKGVPGETSGDGLNRLPEILALDPRVVLLCFGGNDGLQQIPRDQTFANLRQIIDQLQGRGTFVVLIGIRSATVRDKNEKLFAQLARDMHVLYLPNFLDGLLTSPDMMSDTVHPNEKGYEAVADRLEGLLTPLLSGLEGAVPAAR
jgi:acyl-CoA thioesterase-1